MIRFIDLWRAHPFNAGARVDWKMSEAPQLSAQAMTTALVRTGLADTELLSSEPAALVLAARLDAAGPHGFGPRETLSLHCERDVFRALVGRTGVLLNLAGEPRIDVWNGQRSATMGLARWVQLLTVRHDASPKAPETWFWPLPDGCDGPEACGGMELSSGT